MGPTGATGRLECCSSCQSKPIASILIRRRVVRDGGRVAGMALAPNDTCPRQLSRRLEALRVWGSGKHFDGEPLENKSCTLTVNSNFRHRTYGAAAEQVDSFGWTRL